MSIFFWKNKKEEAEPVQEPAPEVTAEAVETAAPNQEPASEEAPEPVQEPAPEDAAEPVQEPAPEEPPGPVQEPAPEEPAEAAAPAEPVEEPMEEAAPAEPSVPVEPAAPVEATPEEAAPSGEEVREYEKFDDSVPEEYDYEAAGAAQNPIPVETYEEPEPAHVNEPAPAVNTAQEAPVPETPVQPQASAYTPEPEYEEEDEKPRGGGGPWLWVFALLVVIACSYYYGMTYSQTHFLNNTYINGKNVSNMTAPEVEKLFYQNADKYELKVKFRDGEEETITGEQIGYKIKPDGSVARILASQDHKKWYKCFFRRTDGEIELNTTYDPGRLKKVVDAMPQLQESRIVEPVNAYIELQGTTFNIIPEVEGNWIDIPMVKNAIYEAVLKKDPEVVVTDLKGSYKEPSVRAKDKEIVEKCEEYNHMLAGSITWILPNDETMTIDKEKTVEWLSRDDDGNYYRDEDLWEENIEFWVDELARNVNTVGRTWNFHATGVGDIEVDGGDYGYSVDKVSEREEVWDLLWDGETDERDPYYYSQQYTRGSGLGGTYIEANLSRQHVWIYIDGEMVCDTDCVSGLPANGRGTPTGVYQILYKDTDTDLKGQMLANGQYSYISHVDYWMPFYNGCGFHDASWRSSFGGTIYKYDGSHGCINLPPSIAPTFYNYVRTGMPVVVFY